MLIDYPVQLIQKAPPQYALLSGVSGQVCVCVVQRAVVRLDALSAVYGMIQLSMWILCQTH